MMTKEELKQEAEKWLIKFLLCNDCKRKCHCIELNAYCEEQVLKAYIDSAEPREKRIAELTDNIREVTRELEEERFVTEDLKKQIEKMKCCINDLVHLGEFNEYTDEEYSNYQVHEALNNAEQFIKEIKEKCQI